MENQILYTRYQGSASELCRKGDAVEFIQPWYTPISTTPENTGMAVGGIGNTFTLTAKGDTPNFSFIPGIFIDCADQDIHFNDFYLSTMDVPDVDNLDITNLTELENFLRYYPALFNGKELSFANHKLVIKLIKEALLGQDFYLSNKEIFIQWNIELSPKTEFSIEQDPRSIQTQILVMLDFFDGLLINTSAKALSLTADRNSGSDIEAIASENIEYKALYPMAEYQYSGIDGIKVKRKVVSPIVKENKKLCSLPMHWNHFSLTNDSDKTQIVTLVQPLQNLIGSTYRKGRDGVQDSACRLTQNPISQQHTQVSICDDESEFIGVELASQSPYASDLEGPVIYGVQANKRQTKNGKISVSVKPSVYSTKAQKQVHNALRTGRVNMHFDRGIYSGRECLHAMVCVQVELRVGEQIDLRFAQVMDHSKIHIQDWHSEKAYAQFFPKTVRAKYILQEMLPQLSCIEENICRQHSDFLHQAQQQISSKTKAERFATMAMNSLSFLAESTVWDIEDKFLVKECVDYPFFNSLDVYFYGSFSLMYLLPELDGGVMKDFADAILAADETKRRYWEYEDKPYAKLPNCKFEGVRALRGAVIHDLGSPYDIQPDAYSWHNVKEWKDLAPKYILMVYRHYEYTNNLDIVDACWPAIKESIKFISNLIEEGDTLPLTRGTDDTFDNLASHGISIYCASLWVAGLKAANKLATLVGDDSLAQEYQCMSDAALQTLESGLWDEEKGYYHFFVTPIQTKHLTGEYYQPLRELGLVLNGNKLEDKNILNTYLDQVDEQSSRSKLQQRRFKKQRLLEVAPQAFTCEYQALVADSDNSFGDALVADSYLKLLGMDGLFNATRIQRTLDYVYQTNFIQNSPKLGVANMTLCDGAPHHEFQAQDVWIGVQFSVATALKLAGKEEQAETLIDTVYNALYGYAKIPFAAPEGFNCSVTVTIDSIAEQFALTQDEAKQWYQTLLKEKSLLADGRVNPNLTSNSEVFNRQLNAMLKTDKLTSLHKWLLGTGLKYTAGRYFRPGMIFAYLY